MTGAGTTSSTRNVELSVLPMAAIFFDMLIFNFVSVAVVIDDVMIDSVVVREPSKLHVWKYMSIHMHVPDL